MIPDKNFSRLSSERLILRRLDADDSESLSRYRSHPDVARLQSWTSFSLEDARVLIAGQQGLHPNCPDGWFRIAVERRSMSGLIGDCTLHSPASEPDQAEIGFMIAPAHQRQGYATEAIRCLLNYVFLSLRKHRVYARTDSRNRAACRVLERCGMRREAHYRQSLWCKGSWCDEFLFAMLQQEWLARETLADGAA